MKISLEYVDLWPKIYLILYLSIGNLKTQVAIARGTLLSNNDEKKFKHSLQMKRKLLLLHSFIRIILSFDEKKNISARKSLISWLSLYKHSVLQIFCNPLSYIWSNMTTVHAVLKPFTLAIRSTLDLKVFNLKKMVLTQTNWKNQKTRSLLGFTS